MKSKFFSFIYLLNTVNAIEITLHGFLYVPTVFHETLADRTNEYLKSKGLDITLKTDFESPITSSGNPVHVANFIEESVLKKDNGYDLYVTDTVYTGRFSQHFEDLSKYVDPNVIDLYKDGTATKTCYVDTKLAGLPLMVDYGGMYSNMNLLNKYNKTIPETWDELIETSNYIYSLESPSNPQLRTFLGHFPDTENGLVTILQYIHSFRDSSTDKFPEYTSENAVAALEKMKEIKNKASTPDDFATQDMDILKTLNNENFIFLLYWYNGDTYHGHNYAFSQLPGKKKGVSASCVGGSNISMNKYITEEKKKAAGEVLSFINSFEQQKFGIMNTDLISAIHSTYSDPEICQKIDCIKFSTMQSIVRPSSSTINYEEYSKKFRDLVRGYLYDETNKSAREVLTEIDDLRKIHFVELNSMVSYAVLTATLIFIILLCLAFIFITSKRFNKGFVFLPYSYWCIFLLGLGITSLYTVVGINKLNNYNCLIKPFLLSVGFTMTYAPFLLKMIVIFPRKNGFSKMVKDHFSLFFLLFIIFDIGLNIAWYLVDPLVVNKLIVTSGKNFQYCSTVTDFGKKIKYSMYGFKMLLLIVMSVFSFTEWNLVAFKSDIRSFTSSIYSNFLIIFIFNVIEKININNRYLYYGIRAALVLVFCYSNLVIIIGMKYYQINIKKDDDFPNIHSFSKGSSNSMNNSSGNNNYYSNNMKYSSNKNTLLNYHYQTGTTVPPTAASKAYPTLFSSTYNNSYNGNIFKNGSSNNTSSHSQSTESVGMGSKNYYNYNYNTNNNFSNHNYSNNNNFSSNNYSNNNYNSNNFNYKY